MLIEVGCHANSIRSPMLEGALRDIAERAPLPQFKELTFDSVGTFRHQVDETAIAVMREYDIDISGHQSQAYNDWHRELTVPDVFIDVTVEASHRQRFEDGLTTYIHIPVTDPLPFRNSPDEVRLPEFRKCRDIMTNLAESVLGVLRRTGSVEELVAQEEAIRSAAAV